MKNISFGLLLTFISALIFEVFGIWQAMVIAGLVGSFVVNRSSHAFFVGFSGVVLCWLTILIYSEIFHEIFPLMKITARVMMMPNNFSFLLFIMTLFLGGILGGLGGLNGLWWRRVVLRRSSINADLR